MTLGMAVSSRGESRRDAVDFHESASNARADMSPRPPPPSDVMVTTHDNQSSRWKERTDTMLATVKMLPKKGNSMSLLCLQMRAVLDQLEIVLEDYSREKTKQWAGGIFRRRLNHVISGIDNNKTTLGIVVTDDKVLTVLPGGPAFQAGLREGDCIMKVCINISSVCTALS